MPKKETIHYHPIKILLARLVNALIAIGTPPLFFFKLATTKVNEALHIVKKVGSRNLNRKRGRKPTLKPKPKNSHFAFFGVPILISFFRQLQLRGRFNTTRQSLSVYKSRTFWYLTEQLKSRQRKHRQKSSNRHRFLLSLKYLKTTGDNFSRFLRTFSNPAFSFLSKRLTRSSKKRPLKSVPTKKVDQKPIGQYQTFFRDSYLITTGAIACFLLIFLPFQGYQLISSLPHPKTLSVRDIPVSTKIYDRNGILLYQFYADENRSLIKVSDLPKYVPQATIAIEDKNFYHHFGFDPMGMIRAAIAITQGKPIQSGSTITQQLIKSALLTPEQTITRKVKEVILSVWAENMYSKDQILTMYLNQVPYGGSTFGVQTASQIYFGKNAKDLTLAEAAYLAGLPSAPSVYSPFGTRPDLAKKRQEQVLLAMVEAGFITDNQAQKALSDKLDFENPETSIKAPHFVMYVRDYLIKKYGSRLVEQGGLEVTTSLDYQLYEKTNEILRQEVEKQAYLSVGNGAVLITNPKTGEILSMSGSTNFFDTTNDGNVNVTVSERSPGSSIKPLTYALGFENKLISPSSIILDTPVSYQSAGQPPYRPQNYDNRFHGPVPVRVALASSYNIPAVRVLEKVGLKNFIDFAKKLGITTFTEPNRYGLALTLGGGEVTMVDMATSYSAFANGGTRTNLKPVLKVKDYLGHTLEDNTNSEWQTKNTTQVISSRTAYLINSILSDDGARSPAFGRGSILNIPNHQVAVKTGTAETKRDNWTIGFTPSFLVAVWVGNNNNSPMSPFLESGNTGAAAIWNPVFQEVLKNQPNEAFTPPSNLITLQICAINGLLPCENCPQITTEVFTPGSEPKVACKITKEEKDRFLNQAQNSNSLPR